MHRFKKVCFLGHIAPVAARIHRVGGATAKQESKKLAHLYVNPIQPLKIEDYFATVTLGRIQLKNVYDYFWPLASMESCAIACLQLEDCYAFKTDEMAHCQLGFVHAGDHVSNPNDTIAYPSLIEHFFFKSSLLQDNMAPLFVTGHKVANIHYSFENYQLERAVAFSLSFCQFICNQLPYQECQMVAYEGTDCLLVRNMSFTIGPDVAAKLTHVPDTNVYHRIHTESTLMENPPKLEKLPNSKVCPLNKFYLVGNGMCDDASNVAECGWDNYECCSIVIQKGKCTECKCHENGLTNMDIAEVIESFLNQV